MSDDPRRMELRRIIREGIRANKSAREIAAALGWSDIINDPTFMLEIVAEYELLAKERADAQLEEIRREIAS